jgi:hypothetical protein
MLRRVGVSVSAFLEEKMLVILLREAVWIGM